MKRSGLIVSVLMLLSTATWAQFRNNVNQRPDQSQRSDNNGNPLRKFYFGGGGSLGFGTGYSYYSVFPIAGYRVTNDFSVGTGVTYQRYNYTYYSPSVSLSQYGVTPFLRYNFNPLFFQTEMDFISSPVITTGSSGQTELVRSVYKRFLIGLGYASPMGRGRSAFNILAMYDLLYTTSEAGIFGSPIVIRLFVTF